MTHPYTNAPDYRRWRRAVGDVAPAAVDPVVSLPFKIMQADKIVTAGSCFAQHIARHLRDNGFSFLVTEPAHPVLPRETAEAFNYGLFTARYGNVYTSRQLLQLIRRAYGRFSPADDIWEEDGRFFDPFRPAIQPGGFASREEYDIDRQQHFRAVRTAFEEADYFIFTLGLTECWVSSKDGAAYPVCPGTIAGSFDADRHRFINLSTAEVVADMTMAINELRTVNPKLRIILTVSPVPLAATAEDRHVLVSTAYSKAVLRVAAEELVRLPDVFYFPSYEIITGPFSRGAYYADDLRNIREEGVEHVMRLFFTHATDREVAPAPLPSKPSGDFLADMKGVVDAICEEAALDQN
ncbi:MAG: GSCFA domain-containing protein [Parvibaculaceae bacterium]|nr:GSCFA domain-containing protein [Parvibaculaceae bacterium]